MQKKLSRTQIQTILNQAPKEYSTETILQGLVDRGYILEGYNEPQPNIVQKVADTAIGGVLILKIHLTLLWMLQDRTLVKAKGIDTTYGQR